MLLQPIKYTLPDDLGLDGVESALAQSHRFLKAPKSEDSLVFLDSFDWRVWQAGAELTFEKSSAGGRLCWIEHRSGEQVACEALQQIPGFSDSLPVGEMRERLSPILEMRTLLPLVRVDRHMRTLRMLDREEKTVVRIVLEENRYSSQDGKQQGPLEPTLTLLPLKGYPKPFLRVQADLENLGLEVAAQTPFIGALDGIGRRPWDYSSKLNYRLDPEQRADAAGRKILLGLLDTMEANISGTRANLDSEFLHDLRVAVRRSRSLLGQVKNIFADTDIERFKQGLGWIGQITGPTRDLDVYLLKFADLRASLPTVVQADLDPFHDFLVNHHQGAQRTLVRKINSPHFRKLMKDWRSWLESPLPEAPVEVNARKPAATVADLRIRKIYHRVLKEGLAITPDSPAEALHDLRKSCKKLRYLMEFFQSLYPKRDIRKVIKAMKILLDNLGDFQDLQVQAESLEDFGEQMLKEGSGARPVIAMGILVGDLLAKQQQARAEFEALFTDFAAQENRDTFRKLFGGKGAA
ncbi:MAG: hypothetical protein OI74_15595 [Gammaproteobacteria bacterium (ex Lamellibrachia satsuma)]|nr:MAG: CHAD domain-containing protein [Gammaproteobacteria bacterium (ex Lamellibrachia satsuma)]RRS31024.1 MAG: hypothetical protein OI74_15595 [Gammaproteobacteria bacterium (ex Lamellibrachia satsuma)]RRS34736.1 MAG: hypothetical protein NV67_12360 [Gammaproteobacteria bacterium (ex Lamellibrachia satsuma)]